MRLNDVVVFFKGMMKHDTGQYINSQMGLRFGLKHGMNGTVFKCLYFFHTNSVINNNSTSFRQSHKAHTFEENSKIWAF